mgnify:FL=1
MSDAREEYIVGLPYNTNDGAAHAVVQMLGDDVMLILSTAAA